MAEGDPSIDATRLVDGIAPRIVVVRGSRVMLSHDLAALYGVPTKALVQAMRRNVGRFPQDFAFQLDVDEFADLRSQVVTSNHGGVRYRPYAFTEQGVAMLSSVLRSDRAVAVNIQIVRTFVKMRSMLQSNHDLATKLAALEERYDRQFSDVFEAIRELVTSPEPTKRPIGFVPS